MENVLDVSLIKVSIDGNNNKYWKIKVENDVSVREWGRVGTKGSQKIENLSIYAAEKLICAKERDGYKRLSLSTTDTENIDKGSIIDKFLLDISDNNSEVLKVLKYCKESNIHNILDKTTMTFNENTGLFSTPLGIVTNSSLIKANNLLLEMRNSLKLNTEISKDTVEKYLSLIPQKVGLKLDVNKLFGTPEKLESQKEILDALKTSLDTKLTSNNNVEIANPFNVKLSPIKNLNEIEEIKQLFSNSIDRNHSAAKLKFSQAFNLNIESMTNNANKEIGNIKRLWHGTRVGNVLSIMKNGMKIFSSKENAVVTGRMFGNGLYFSDISTKALNYSLGTWNSTGKGSSNKYYALICDVIMGEIWECKSSSERLPKNGYNSTFAKKGVDGLKNNEMIVYNENQVIPVYLVEFIK